MLTELYADCTICWETTPIKLESLVETKTATPAKRESLPPPPKKKSDFQVNIPCIAYTSHAVKIRLCIMLNDSAKTWPYVNTSYIIKDIWLYNIDLRVINNETSVIYVDLPDMVRLLVHKIK